MLGVNNSVALAFLVTLLLMMALRPFASAVKLIDIPGGRKSHIGEVPIIGGLAMFIGLIFGLALLGEALTANRFFLLASGLLVFIGTLDDKFDLPASVRLIAQGTAAMFMVVGSGLVVTEIGNPFFFGTVHLGILAVPFTVLVTMTVVNAFNMCDGMDGLAGGVALITLVPLAIIAGVAGVADYQAAIILIMMAVVCAFLVFNFPFGFNGDVRSFMGDAGATLLGFGISWFCISLAQGDIRAMTPVTGLWLVALPLFDIFSSLIRRISKGESPLKADRKHFHHILQRAGFSVRAILVMLLGMSALCSLIGIAGLYAGVPQGVMFLGWVAFGVAHYWIIRRAWVFARWLRQKSRATGTV